MCNGGKLKMLPLVRAPCFLPWLLWALCVLYAHKMRTQQGGCPKAQGSAYASLYACLCFPFLFTWSICIPCLTLGCTLWYEATLLRWSVTQK